MHIPIDGTHVQLLAGSDNYDAKMKKKANKMAKEISATMVDKKPLALIMNCENTRKIWIKLLDVYEQRYLLQSQFGEYLYVAGDDIAIHISKVELFTLCLREPYRPISDSLVIIILNTIALQYCHFHSVWDSTSLDDHKLLNLTSRLMIEETKLGIVDESALVIWKNNTQISFSKPDV